MKSKASLGSSFAKSAAQVATQTKRFPLIEYQDRPDEFVHNILGQKTWDKQDEILYDIRNHPYGAVRAGRKVSKSNTIACASIWFYSCFERANVNIISSSANQLRNIIWLPEVVRLISGSGRCVRCKEEDPFGPRPCPHSMVIPEKPNLTPWTGIRAPDGRQLIGTSPSHQVNAQGASGANILYLFDESPGIQETIFHAAEGNLAGMENGGMWMFMNPNIATGFTYDVFDNQKLGYKTHTISSEDSPNVKAGRTIIPGLATKDYITRMEETWGRDHPMFQIHVLGQHVLGEDGKIISKKRLLDSVSIESVSMAGTLRIGIDPAGDSGEGDESVMIAVRGLAMLDMRTSKSWTEDELVAQMIELASLFGKPGEKYEVIYDSGGEIGSKLRKRLGELAESSQAFYASGVNAGGKAQVNEKIYRKQRDLLWAGASEWIKRGGRIINDRQLINDLNAPSWQVCDDSTITATPKRRLKILLNRSPDRGDAACLAVWPHLPVRNEEFTHDTVDKLPIGTHIVETWWVADQ